MSVPLSEKTVVNRLRLYAGCFGENTLPRHRDLKYADFCRRASASLQKLAEMLYAEARRIEAKVAADTKGTK